ncbi:MAG: 3-phosphoserine/phosphohydroxythreonine transaminase [Bacteroidetes bacterium]|nr:3-phosphoserine/phosphohydroxythreonine transaminase [Bacteroidota bacterium]
MNENSPKKHKINFGGGPAALPPEVFADASEAVLDYNGTGLSILEIGHRSKEFMAILEESKAIVKELCGINEDYEVLWLHGGGRLQFAMIPMNFLGDNDTAGYIDSGHWATEAAEYAMHYGGTNIVSTSREGNYAQLPAWPKRIDGNLAYLHYTTNNTIYGTQWHKIPDCNVPLVADMSSDIFSKQMDYSKCALFYAAAQKNIGPAGATLVVMRRDMAERIKRDLPPMLSYKAQIAQHSVLNTSPVFAIYTSLLMLRWTKARGIAAIEQENKEKAALLYREIDRNGLFEAVVKKETDRSTMNVCFRIKNEAQEKTFVSFCEKRNITGISGHRFVGGFRVSLYNAIRLEHVERLAEVMRAFESNNDI